MHSIVISVYEHSTPYISWNLKLMGINDKKKIEALFEFKMYTAHTIRMHITSIED